MCGSIQTSRTARKGAAVEILIKNSTAYKIFCREADAGRLAHAYMLSFEDGANLREALKIFALKYFSTAAEERCGGQIMREVYPDCKIYPEPGKKFNAEAAVALIEDSAMRPTVGEKKLYIISSFEDCSPIVQNKLLKVIEEPPAGVGFILGATTLSPVLSTILSRVRLLEIAPFTQQQIFEAVWNEDSDTCRHAVVNIIHQLRKKIEPDPAQPVYIQTVIHTGYKFVIPKE